MPRLRITEQKEKTGAAAQEKINENNRIWIGICRIIPVSFISSEQRSHRCGHRPGEGGFDQPKEKSHR